MNNKVLFFLIYFQLFNLLFIEESIAGSDFFLISISYLMGIIFLNKYAINGNKSYYFISFFLLFFFYGSRITFIFLLPINYFLFIQKYENKKINNFFIPQLFLSFILIFIPLIFDISQYHPIHILFKGYGLLGFYGFIVILLITLCFFIAFMYLHLHHNFFTKYRSKINSQKY